MEARRRCSWFDGRSSPSVRTVETTLSKSSTPTSLSSGIGDLPSSDTDDRDNRRRPYDVIDQSSIDPIKLGLYLHWANGCGCGEREHFAPPNVEYCDSADMKQVNRIKLAYNPCPHPNARRRNPLVGANFVYEYDVADDGEGYGFERYNSSANASLRPGAASRKIPIRSRSRSRSRGHITLKCCARYDALQIASCQDSGVGGRILRLLAFLGFSSCCSPQVGEKQGRCPHGHAHRRSQSSRGQSGGRADSLDCFLSAASPPITSTTILGCAETDADADGLRSCSPRPSARPASTTDRLTISI